MLTETDRRILANLSEPRSLPNLTRILRNDAYAPFDAAAAFESVRDEVAGGLKDLAARGLVVSIGSHSEAKSALRAVADNKDAIALPKVKADALRERLDSGRDSRLDTGELVILSKAGLDELTA